MKLKKIKDCSKCGRKFTTSNDDKICDSCKLERNKRIAKDSGIFAAAIGVGALAVKNKEAIKTVAKSVKSATKSIVSILLKR